jgi:hypothetical protein
MGFRLLNRFYNQITSEPQKQTQDRSTEHTNGHNHWPVLVHERSSHGVRPGKMPTLPEIHVV